eukprot:EG_transcript_20363
MEADLRAAAAKLAAARRVVVFSGAGLSKESGISTFRGEGGLWSTFFNLSLIYFGTPLGWRLTPQLTWYAYLTQFLAPISQAAPNAGHSAIAELERLLVPRAVEVTVITQNVDGLHQRAGSTPRRVHELHGTVNRYECSARRHPQPEGIHETEGFRTTEFSRMPRCMTPGCRSFLRPACTLFGESLPEDAWELSAEAIRRLQPGDVVLVVGTSGVVYPAASLPEVAAQRKGVHTVEINPSTTPLTPLMSAHLPGPSGELLPKLLECLKSELQSSPIVAATATPPASSLLSDP